MLVLSGRPGEAILIDSDPPLRLVVLGTTSNRVKLGFEADPSLKILREAAAQEHAALNRDEAG